MGWDVYKIYTDPGYSGASLDRPGLKEMIRDIEAGLIDKVVVYKLDRLSRSQKDTLYLIEDVFLKNNTDFVSMSENFDTSSPFGIAMIGILAVFAQLDRAQIKERMTMGREARAKEGKWNGGERPTGYQYDKEKDLLVIDPYEAAQVREAFDLFVSGMSIRGIETLFYKKGYSHKSGPWSTLTIKKILQNKTYLGYVKYNGEYFKAEHDAIIDEEIFDKARKIFEQRAELYPTGPQQRKHDALLSGLIRCYNCGARYHKRQISRKGSTPVHWYACYSRSKSSAKMIVDPTCKNKNWKVKDLDKIIVEEIKKLKTDPDYISTIREEAKRNVEEPSKVAMFEHEIAKIDAQISRFMDLYGIGKFTIDQVSAKVDPLNETRRNLQRELEALNAETGRITETQAREVVETFEELIDRGNFDEIRLAVETLIYYVEIDNEDIIIHWRFS
jgi:site-specific DNA recombinase